MAKTDYAPQATFRVFLREDKTYGVEVTIPESLPTIVSSFATEAAAEAWIANYHTQVAARSTFRRFGRPSAKRPA